MAICLVELGNVSKQRIGACRVIFFSTGSPDCKQSGIITDNRHDEAVPVELLLVLMMIQTPGPVDSRQVFILLNTQRIGSKVSIVVFLPSQANVVVGLSPDDVVGVVQENCIEAKSCISCPIAIKSNH